MGVLVFFLSVAAVSYSIALQVRGTGLLRILALFVGVHFVLYGVVVASCAWFVSNKYLRVQSFHGVEQRMEWMYAFDIHCNSFFPLFLVLYVIHYFLLPFWCSHRWWQRPWAMRSMLLLFAITF